MDQKEAKKQRDKQYSDYVQQVTPKHKTPLNVFRAFIVGGAICLMGQALTNWFISMGIDGKIASSYTTLILITVSAFLTGFNLTSPIVRFAGAGFLVPITGFANSVAACAIEYKKEGQVFGIGCKIFTIAGPVILYGTVCSAFFGAIYYIIMEIGLF